MTKLESIKSNNFKQLSEEEKSNVNGGAIFPKNGVDVYNGTLGDQSGATNQPWRTGWFSSTKVYGDAYWTCSDNCN